MGILRKLAGNLTFANVIAVTALFVALGGSAYAATQLPGNSVGTKQLKKEAVTPGKLSATSKAALTGPTGPKGDAGPQGPQGDRGPEGPQGLPGLTGSEPFVIDALGAEAETAPGTSVNVPLSGTTSWTTGPAQAGLLFGRFVATIGAEVGFNCPVSVRVFDDGKEVAVAQANYSQPAFVEMTKAIAPTAIAFHEPGPQTITATFSTLTSCLVGTKLHQLELIVSPLG